MKIGQLSKHSGLTTHTIRYDEKMGLLQPANKDGSGHHDYHESDLDLVNWIACLTKSGMPLQKIREYAQFNRDKNTLNLVEILDLDLEKLKAQQKDIKHYITVTSE